MNATEKQIVENAKREAEEMPEVLLENLPEVRAKVKKQQNEIEEFTQRAKESGNHSGY